MKKLLVLLMVIVLTCTFLASCDILPPAIKDTIDDLLGKTPDDGPSEHVHDFVLKSSTKPTCLEAGKDTFECSCGETKVSESGNPLGHNYTQGENHKAATCTTAGYNDERCVRCGDKIEGPVDALGHNYAAMVEVSRLMPCLNESCSSALLPEGDGKYKEVIVFKYTDADLARFDAIYAELEAIIDAADPYDATLHALAKDTPLHEQYLAMEAKYEELYDVVEYIVTQYQIAQIEYHMSMKDTAKKDAFDNISKVRTDLVAKFYTFSKPLYDSMYREFYYEGMTEPEIMAFILESDAVSNPEYKALVDRNNEIELEFNEINNPTTDDKVLTLYAEFVANNKKIAELLGYGNYLEYAYESVYSRDYTYQDVAKVAGYVKEHLSDSFSLIFDAFYDIYGSSKVSKEDNEAFYNQAMDSFFTNYESNRLLNDYIDTMSFTSNPDKQISFSDELNGLMGNGNLFRGSYSGAYVTSLMDINVPIAYFSPGYDSPSTISHEFGHYMNEVYNKGEYDQSYDLLEMHSQGNELVFMLYLSEQLPEMGFKLYERYQLLNMYMTVLSALAVDTFEQAIYTDYYKGTYSKSIMADGTITSDEYDKVYRGILIDLGIGDSEYERFFGGYWRYVTIGSPCYYVSYSISALSVLQLYADADERGFDATADSYLKLFTYTDTNPDLTTAEILVNAGLRSFTDEELYVSLKEMIEEVSE